MKEVWIFKVVVIGVVFCFISSAFCASDDAYWPTWRGPDMMGLSPAGNPPVKWSETESIKWKIELTGDGSNSSPIVWENKIIYQTAVKTDKVSSEEPTDPQEGQGRRGGGTPKNIYKFNLVCRDRNSGKLLWEKTATEQLPHQGHHPDHGFASFSPITDGTCVWADFGSYGMYCYDMDGNRVWKQDMMKMSTRFGEGNSPVLADGKVIVTADHEGDSFIYAFDKKTGEIAWQKARDEKTSYASPIVVEGYGPLQVVASATGKIRSYNVANGEVLWECGGMTRNVIPTPVVGFDMIYCASGFRGSALLAIKLGRTGDLTGTDAIAWHVDEATPYVPSILLYGRQLYVLSVDDGILSCYDAETGKSNYIKQEMDQLKGVYASPVGAADRVYFVGRNGVTYVLKNSTDYEVLAINKLEDGIDCSPAIVGNQMFLKGKKYLYCLQVPEVAGK